MATKVKVKIREVWADNLEEEFAIIRELIDDYPYVAMDTEFPGVVNRPIGSFSNATTYFYHTLKCNCDVLKIIQLGLTLSDSEGKLPPKHCTWQFNFKFNINEDMFAPESIELLSKSGIEFKRHEQLGIDVNEFGELLMTSGVILNEDIRWISFHSAYDFGYLMRVVTAKPLPEDECEFFALLNIFFPRIFDIKYIVRMLEFDTPYALHGGLQRVAETLEVERHGPMHQAGSDSLLTLTTFFRLRSLAKSDIESNKDVFNVLFGLGVGCPYVNTVAMPGALDAIATDASADDSRKSIGPE